MLSLGVFVLRSALARLLRSIKGEIRAQKAWLRLTLPVRRSLKRRQRSSLSENGAGVLASLVGMDGLQPTVFELPSQRANPARAHRPLPCRRVRAGRAGQIAVPPETASIFCNFQEDYRFASEEAAAATAGQVAPQPPPQGGALAAEADPAEAGAGAPLLLA